jgi:short-subunit dehydrogenase
LRGFSQALRRELADTNIQVRYFAPRTTKTSFNTSNIDEMNKLLGNKSDLPEQVANAFYQFIKQKKWQKILGFKESFFVFINNLLPAIPDKAISKQLNIIKRFL